MMMQQLTRDLEAARDQLLVQNQLAEASAAKVGGRGAGWLRVVTYRRNQLGMAGGLFRGTVSTALWSLLGADGLSAMAVRWGMVACLGTRCWCRASWNRRAQPRWGCGGAGAVGITRAT